MTDAWKRRLIAIAALAVAAGVLGWVSMGEISEESVYYLSPAEVRAKNAVGKTVRLGGVVEPGTIDYNPEKMSLAFAVVDGDQSMRVVSTGTPPQMFREGIGVIVEGELNEDGVFVSDRLMVKHDNEYKDADGESYDPSKHKTADAGAAQ